MKTTCLITIGCVACAHRGPVAGRADAEADMIAIPAGRAVVGCDQAEADCPDVALPRRTVEHAASWIDRLEVSGRAFAACVAAGACHGGPELRDARSTAPAIARHPDDARAYCAGRDRHFSTS